MFGKPVDKVLAGCAGIWDLDLAGFGTRREVNHALICFVFERVEGLKRNGIGI